MIFSFDILKVGSLREWRNQHFLDNSPQKRLMHLRMITYGHNNQLRKTELQPMKLFEPPDEKQYETNFKFIVISIFRLMHSNLEILLTKNAIMNNDVIKWLPVVH
jgi:hypothetical protein